jgi:hypothetical protein
MGNIKLKFNNNFTCVPNVVFEQKERLSVKSIGLYCFIISRPENWEFSIEGTCAYLDEGRTIIRTAIDELEEIGLLKCTQNNEKGKFGSAIWEVFDAVLPSSGFPTSGKPTSGNSPQIKKNRKNNTTPNGDSKHTQEAEPETPKDPEFEKFEAWCKANAKNVLRMKEPLTGEQLKKLKQKFSTETIAEVFQQMHNKADLLKKYTSAYLTALDWCKRRDADKKAGSGAKSASNGRGGTSTAKIKNLPVLTGLNAKSQNWYNEDAHPLAMIADRFGAVDYSKTNTLPKGIRIESYQTLTIPFPEHMKTEKHRFIDDLFAVFDDGTFQPLGTNQKMRFENLDLTEKDIRKGIIH